MTSERPNEPSQKLRILVIDDQRIVGEVLVKLLIKLGYEGYWSSSWAEAKARVEKGVDVILLDLRMPEMSGYDCLDLIRGLAVEPSPKVYAVSGDSSRSTQDEVSRAGFDGFLAKPFTMDTIKQMFS